MRTQAYTKSRSRRCREQNDVHRALGRVCFPLRRNHKTAFQKLHGLLDKMEPSSASSSRDRKGSRVLCRHHGKSTGASWTRNLDCGRARDNQPQHAHKDSHGPDKHNRNRATIQWIKADSPEQYYCRDSSNGRPHAQGRHNGRSSTGAAYPS